MIKISNPVIGRIELPGVAGFLTFADVAQNYFTNATAALTATDYQTWKTANPTVKPITITAETGMDGVTGLLVESTSAATSDIPNSLINQTFITGATDALMQANLVTWKTNNPAQKILTQTLLTGNDGVTGYLIEYTVSGTSSALPNSATTQLVFIDGVTPSYTQYLNWRAANPTLKPIRLSNYIANDAKNGILIDYAFAGNFPSAGQIQQTALPDNVSTAATSLQTWKTANPNSRILRLTITSDVLLVEFTANGPSPANSDMLQSYYASNPANPDGNTTYQTFKTANPTLRPVRLTEIIWGDGTTGILAEYIS